MLIATCNYRNIFAKCSKTSTPPPPLKQMSKIRGRSGKIYIFGVAFLLFLELRDKGNFAILTRKSRSHVRILISRAWPITTNPSSRAPVCPVPLTVKAKAPDGDDK